MQNDSVHNLRSEIADASPSSIERHSMTSTADTGAEGGPRSETQSLCPMHRCPVTGFPPYSLPSTSRSSQDLPCSVPGPSLAGRFPHRAARFHLISGLCTARGNAGVVPDTKSTCNCLRTGLRGISPNLTRSLSPAVRTKKFEASSNFLYYVTCSLSIKSGFGYRCYPSSLLHKAAYHFGLDVQRLGYNVDSPHQPVD